MVASKTRWRVVRAGLVAPWLAAMAMATAQTAEVAPPPADNPAIDMPLVPDRATRILIYCNNNFRGAEGPFPGKLPVASLNLSTWVALYSYGYRDVYELAPLLDLDASALELESSTPAAL